MMIPQFPGDAPQPDFSGGAFRAYAEVLPLISKGGAWDYKRIDPSNLNHYDDIGNFNAGAVGAALGIPLPAMLLAGDIDQRKETGTWDESDDKVWIRQGYRYYYEVYGSR